MTRFTMMICTWWISMTGLVPAPSPPGISAAAEGKPTLVKTVTASHEYMGPAKNLEILPPVRRPDRRRWPDRPARPR